MTYARTDRPPFMYVPEEEEIVQMARLILKSEPSEEELRAFTLGMRAIRAWNEGGMDDIQGRVGRAGGYVRVKNVIKHFRQS